MLYFQLEDGNQFLKIYDGGSKEDARLSSLTGNPASPQISSSGSQLFVTFNSNGNVMGKGFSASIILGINIANNIHFIPI